MPEIGSPGTPHDDALSRYAAESFSAAHPADLAEVPSASERRRALVEQLAAGPRSQPPPMPVAPRVPRRTVGGTAIALAVALAAVALLVLAWPRSPATDPKPAAYQLELGGAATELGAGDRVRPRRGDAVVIRARPAHPMPKPRVQARWSSPSSASALGLAVEHEAGGAVIVRTTIDRDPGHHTLELLIGDEACAWDRSATGCEQPSIDVEVVR